MKRFLKILFWFVLALAFFLVVLARSVAHGQNSRSGGSVVISTKPHGIGILMPAVSGASMCATGGGSVWTTDISPTFGSLPFTNGPKFAVYQTPWNLIQPAINTYNFSTFNTNCPTAEFGITKSAVIWQNESTGGALTNNFLPGWYNSIITLATGTSVAMSTTTVGSFTTAATTPLFGTGDTFCLAGTVIGVGTHGFNSCNYTSTGASTSGSVTTVTFTTTDTHANTDTATGGFANDTASGNAALVITSLSPAASCNGSNPNCVITATLDGTKGSFLNSIPLPPANGLPMGGTSYNGEQIQISGSKLTGSVGFDGVWILCDASSNIPGCINPTASSFTYRQVNQLAADSATGGFAGNPIVSDTTCHPHTQATKWIPNFLYAWENFITQLKLSEDSLGFVYFRIPFGVGGENRVANSYCDTVEGHTCACRTDMLSDAAQTTPINDTVWQNQIAAYEAYAASLNFTTPILQSVSVLQSTDYQNADTMAKTHVANGFGIGSQALNNTDISTFTANTLASDGNVHYGQGNDMIYIFPQYCGTQVFCENQLVNQEDMTGASDATANVSGRLTKLLNLPLGFRSQIFEIFFQDALSTWDANWCPWTLAATCTAASTNFANFESGNLLSDAANHVSVSNANPGIMTSSVANFSTAWPAGMTVCVGGTAANCSDGTLFNIGTAGCSSTTSCTLDRASGGIAATTFKTYNNSANLASIAGYSTYLAAVSKQIN